MRYTLIIVVAILLAPAAAMAQLNAVTNGNAPIYIGPAVSPVPLRVAAPHTTLRVFEQQEDWVQVQFNDPQWGPRTGWVRRSLVTISDPALEPMDLSITEEATAAPQPTPSRGTNESGSAPVSSDGQRDPRPNDARINRQARHGLWFNVGLGFGTLGCQNCAARWNGLSGGLSLGGTISDRFLLAVGTTGFARSEDSQTWTVGTLDARLRFYPSRTSGFFITGGVGVGSYSIEGQSELGLGVVLGLGWDIRVGRNVSLTPFWNGFAMSNSLKDANVGQVGLGITIH